MRDEKTGRLGDREKLVGTDRIVLSPCLLVSPRGAEAGVHSKRQDNMEYNAMLSSAMRQCYRFVRSSAMPPFDPHAIRPLFPALSQEVAGRPAVFFDAPGGTQVPTPVIAAISDYLAHSNANTHGAFATSRRTDETIAAAHQAMADLLGCAPEETVFGANMTTLTFALSRALGRELGAGDEIVVTRLDHDANVAPWRALEERGVTIREVDVDIEDCTLDLADLEAQLSARTRLVAVGYASNAVGTINDVARVVALARQAGALSFVDAVHYAPHGPIDVAALGCDFLACSVYKFFGPHVGVLYGKAAQLERLRPYKVRPASNASPERWMTGTQNHEGLAGVTAAVDYLAGLGDAPAGGAGGGNDGD
jgi:cysteine desulfurase family protein (TIGR01976 family)